MQMVITNDPVLYKQELSVQKNAMRRMIKGTFNPQQAVKLWGYLVTRGAAKYRKDFGGDASTFNPRTRELVARRMVRGFMAEVRSGNIDPASLGMKGTVHPKFRRR